jgi:hypothetical protein
MADALSEGKGTVTAEDGADPAGLAALAGDDEGGAAAAVGWLPPSVTVSATPPPTRARTLAKTATPERKLMASMRAFMARLSLAAQPVPSLTTKHDTGDQGLWWDATEENRW